MSRQEQNLTKVGDAKPGI